MATELNPVKTQTEELIEQSIAEEIKEIGNEIYRFNEASELKIYLENKFGVANVREMLKVLLADSQDKIEELEEKVSRLKDSLKDADAAISLFIPEPSTLNWNYDQLPERLTPQEKQLVVDAYNETKFSLID